VFSQHGTEEARRDGACGLLAGGRFLPWSFTGYLAPVALRLAAPVEVLTRPRPWRRSRPATARVLHPSAARWLGADNGKPAGSPGPEPILLIVMSNHYDAGHVVWGGFPL
jgi:hypothetical protein